MYEKYTGVHALWLKNRTNLLLYKSEYDTLLIYDTAFTQWVLRRRVTSLGTRVSEKNLTVPFNLVQRAPAAVRGAVGWHQFHQMRLANMPFLKRIIHWIQKCFLWFQFWSKPRNTSHVGRYWIPTSTIIKCVVFINVQGENAVSELSCHSKIRLATWLATSTLLETKPASVSTWPSGWNCEATGVE
mgnify:CR=1 FL=1